LRSTQVKVVWRIQRVLICWVLTEDKCRRRAALPSPGIENRKAGSRRSALTPRQHRGTVRDCRMNSLFAPWGHDGNGFRP
jgi:hypothetical protein